MIQDKLPSEMNAEELIVELSDLAVLRGKLLRTRTLEGHWENEYEAGVYRMRYHMARARVEELAGEIRGR